MLESIGEHGEASSAQVAARLAISRVTAYGLLETLVEAGYLHRDGPRDHYRMTNRPMLLVRGLDTITRAATIAVPVLRRLTEDWLWPLEFTVRSGLDMLILETSDRWSPCSIARLKRRDSVPIHRCAAGFAYLAFCGARERQDIERGLIERAADTGGGPSADFFDTYLPIVRSVGFSRIDLAEYSERSLAAPIHVGGTTIGALQLRYIMGSPIDWRRIGALLIAEADAIGRQVEALRDELAVPRAAATAR